MPRHAANRSRRARKVLPPDPAPSDAIAAEGFGEVIEVRPDDTVDGDFNGTPELEALGDSVAWEGVDALQGMEGRDRELPRESGAAAEVLSDAVAERRLVLIERLDDARELGLGDSFEAAIAASDPAAGGGPVISDETVLRERLELIDAAIEELERRSASEPD